MLAAARWQRSSWMMALVLLAMLLALAAFQYRWTGELSRAERERMRSGLETASARFVGDFDRELTRALIHFQPRLVGESADLGIEYAQLLDEWRDTAPYPRLVSGIWLATLDEEAVGLSHLDSETEEFRATPWPSDLGALRRRFESAEHAAPGPGEGEDVPPFRFLAAQTPALLLPLVDARRPERFREPMDLRSLVQGVIIVRLDLEFLREELLPVLARTYFAGDGELDYELAVVMNDGSGRPIYRSSSSPSAAHLLTGDLEAEMFALADREELRKLWLETRPSEPLGELRRGRGPRWRGDPWPLGRRHPAPLLGRAQGEAGWKLIVRHRQGSLEAAVSRIRHRNLAVSFGILTLLGATVLMLLISSRRAQRLARQQVEFVAGISHELRTPLAAIGSLAQNLSDGIVFESDQVRSYGSMIHREEQRLRRMVDQTLAFAGSLRERGAYKLERSSLAEIVRGAISDCEALFEESGLRLESNIPEELPTMLADAPAMRQAVSNLIRNAVRHSGSEEWIGVFVEAVGGDRGAELVVRIEDRGRGIPAEDLPHLFEPFFRGRHAAEAQTEGSGLGLSVVRRIVEAHQGKVEVQSEPQKGSVFTLRFPALGEDREQGENPAG